MANSSQPLKKVAFPSPIHYEILFVIGKRKTPSNLFRLEVERDNLEKLKNGELTKSPFDLLSTEKGTAITDFNYV